MRHLRAAVVKGILGLLVGMASCSQMGGIRDGTLREGTCATLADCKVDEPECRKALACAGERCVFEDASDGTPLSKQTLGDCVEVVCDGSGSTRIQPLAADAPPDGDSCTLDSCVGMTPTYTKKTELPCFTGPVGALGKGTCAAGVQHCDEQGKPISGCVGEVLPKPETCASWLDDDCDGAANEEGADCACTPGQTRACYTGPSGTEGIGECYGGTQSCAASGVGFGACEGEMTPRAESCSSAGLDEDCDGEIDEGGDGCVCGDGVLSVGEECDDGGTSDLDACSAVCEEQRVLQVQALSSATCALLSGGRVKCWGYNGSGELGLGDTDPRGGEPGQMGSELPAVDLGSGKTPVAIAPGAFHACAILNDGSVKCWGANAGQLGLGDTNPRGDQPDEMGDKLPPVNLGSGKTALAIAAGVSHTCAILNDGSVKCWGVGLEGVLGRGDTDTRGDEPGEMGDSLPVVDLGTGKKATAIAAGAAHTCVLFDDGTVKCWGRNTSGQLGLGDIDARGDAPGEMGDNLPAIKLGSGKTATAIAAGQAYTCAILNDGSVKCWGVNTYGNLGLGNTQSRGNAPNETGDFLPAVNLGTGKTAVAIDLGVWHTCAILNDGSVKCWGGGGYGKLGLGDVMHRGTMASHMGDALPAVDLGAQIKASAISATEWHTCALLHDGSVKCWGRNKNGELGLGDTKDRGDAPNEMGDNLPRVKLFSSVW